MEHQRKSKPMTRSKEIRVTHNYVAKGDFPTLANYFVYLNDNENGNNDIKIVDKVFFDTGNAYCKNLVYDTHSLPDELQKRYPSTAALFAENCAVVITVKACDGKHNPFTVICFVSKTVAYNIPHGFKG